MEQEKKKKDTPKKTLHYGFHTNKTNTLKVEEEVETMIEQGANTF